jgi:hypothetical protein
VCVAQTAECRKHKLTSERNTPSPLKTCSTNTSARQIQAPIFYYNWFNEEPSKRESKKKLNVFGFEVVWLLFV